MKHQIPPKTLLTNRLMLRPFQMGDETQMFKNWCQDQRVTQFLTWETHQSIDITTSVLSDWVSQYQAGPNYHWAIVELKNNELIGSIGLVKLSEFNERGEIGYCIAYDYWNQGIVTEALSEIIKYLFNDIGFNKLTAKHATQNGASGKVMIKCGMKLEGVLLQEHKNKQGTFDDMAVYGCLNPNHHQAKTK